jgi:ABC-type dipeptide/oligopeptide/nickel transport system ATPase component
MDLTFDFKSIRSSLEINYINNLIKTCDKNNINKEILLEKLDELNLSDKEIKEEIKELTIKKNLSSNSLSETNNNLSPNNLASNNLASNNLASNNLSSYNNQTPKTPSENIDYLYQKPWTKLTPIHKIIKIKEFVNQLLIKDEKDKLELKDKLVEMVKNKTLTKKEAVLYDPVKAKVISIPLLKFKDDKYLI